MTAVIGCLEEQIGDDEDRGRHRDGEQHHARDREAVRDQEQLLLVAVAEADPVERRRRDQEDRATHGAEERHHVHVLLEVGDPLEPLGERHREQEREQHLHAGERDPQLVQELDQLTVNSFLLGLRHGPQATKVTL